jgi:hypothetical protein
MYNENIYYDAKIILRELIKDKKTGIVYIEPGSRECTDWRAMRMFYGESSIAEITPKGIHTTLLKDWVVKNKTTITIRITPHRTKLIQPSYMKDIHSYIEHLSQADDEEINFLWRIRNLKTLHDDFNKRDIIWKECEKRYPGLQRSGIKIKLTQFDGLDIEKVKGNIVEYIMNQEWPECIKNWHRTKITFSVAEPQTIGDALINVNKPWRPTTCPCANICKEFKKREPTCSPCMIDDHLFIIGREYDGPVKEVLRTPANNIPIQTAWDAKRSYENIWKQIPQIFQPPKKEWLEGFGRCCKDFLEKKDFIRTKHVFTLRKILKGMVIGPTDKNLNELWAICPILYKKAWDKLYCEETGYKPIRIDKYSAKTAKEKESIYNTDNIGTNKGSDKDIIKHWAMLYKKRGWNKFASYDTKGAFNVPYAILKGKNIINKTTRLQKWSKGRPIAPQTKHPMRRLFHKTGRAWAFLTAQTDGEEFTMKSSKEVPEFLQQMQQQLGNLGTIHMDIQDIEGCFPNMPKEAIKLALRDKVQQLQRKGINGVCIPNKDTLPCVFQTKKKYGYVTIPLSILYDVMEFALNNTLIKDMDGNLRQQTCGIPMGDPHSPGMAIGTCAWMENLWMQTINSDSKKFFKAKRYMDDILTFYVTNPRFDHGKLLDEFKQSQCYWPPLNLENANNGIFLETQIEIRNNTIRHKLKNDNAKEIMTWRYMHINSNNKHTYKKAALITNLRKVDYMASDDMMLIGSAIDKLREFVLLGYPKGMLYDACTKMAVLTRAQAWFMIRGKLNQWYA